MGEALRTRKAAWFAAALSSLVVSGARGDEDWEPGSESNCAFEAWADEADIAWLDKELASQQYVTASKSNKFDFIGPAHAVPYHAGCGEVWVSACRAEDKNHWIKLKECSAPTTNTEVPSSTITAVSTATAIVANTSFTEPAGGTCSVPEPEPDPLPGPVTSRMQKAAEGILPLTDDYHRQNHSLVGGSSAQAGVSDTRGGSDVNDEVAAWANDSHSDQPVIMHRFEQVAGQPWREVSRAAVAVVAHEGFSRDITSLYQVIRVHDDGHFHNDAEGLNLIEKRAAEKEREAQLALVDALAQVESKLKADPVVDHASIATTEAYRQLALLRARNLAAVACQLGNLAAIDADRENRMRSLGGSPITGGSGGDPGSSATRTDKSDISGIEPVTMVQVSSSGVKVETMTSTESGSSTSTTILMGNDVDEALRSFGPREVSGRALASDTDLFTRVHAKMQEREAKGEFSRGMDLGDERVELP